MMKLTGLLIILHFLFIPNLFSQQSNDFLKISGVYPHLSVYNPGDGLPCEGNGNECGIGAVVPWAGKLWMITYSPHCPAGSSDKLWVIDDRLNLKIHPASIGGTPANRLIHKESEQLIIGPYFIDKNGHVRVVTYTEMPGRHTATARHLTDPENMVYFQDMEGKLYEINVHSLAVKKLFEKPVPGWHAKGAYTSQGRYVMANNGEHEVFDIDPRLLQAGGPPQGEEDVGVLAEWDGNEWRIIERKQFCDVTGPGGIYAYENMDEPIWSIGWDKRSVILKLLDKGRWYTYRLPKATHTYDHIGGWYTEWPRIREIGGGRMLMDMHGMLYEFPKTFSASNVTGLKPISNHLRIIPDFCEWNGQLVLASDETTLGLNEFAGRSQSNLWFGKPEELESWGPTSGWGGCWIQDMVNKDMPSDPFLFSNPGRKVFHLVNHSEIPVSVIIEQDSADPGKWEGFDTIQIDPRVYRNYIFRENSTMNWIRLRTDRDCRITAYLHFSHVREYSDKERHIFTGLAEVDENAIAGMIRPASRNMNLQFLDLTGGVSRYMEVDEKISFIIPEENLSDEVLEVCGFKADFDVDEASVKVSENGKTWRLPKTNSSYDKEFATGWPRGIREIETQRYMMNIHGTFYEMPREAGMSAIRPVSTHGKQIIDFCSWRGLLVFSGISKNAKNNGHVFRSEDGKTGLWFGAVDDIWKLGKPVGSGGPWKNARVRAGELSDPFLMTGYDRKTLWLEADGDVEITAEIDFDHHGWYHYKTFKISAGEKFEYLFPEGFSAHWIRFSSNKNCVITASLIYQ